MLLTISIILLFLVLTASLSKNLNIPIIILALAVGIIFGSDVTGIIYFDDAVLVQKIANIALIFILFAGGFNIKSRQFKPVFKQATVLATFGVLLTAFITAGLFYLISDWPFLYTLLLGAIVSSTDAAAVFSILQTRKIAGNVSSLTEIESAANDPMAIVLTTFLLELLRGKPLETYHSIFVLLWQLLGGLAIGAIIGYIAISIIRKIKHHDIGYYYLFFIAIILFSFSLADMIHASGMLATFFAGYTMGNQKFPFKQSLSWFGQMLSFIANVGLFILLGLLVFPKQFSNIWWLGVILFLLITFLSRPITILICTLFSSLKLREKMFLSWSGIRGAVPIVLATYPAAVGLDPDHQIFNTVFFAVTLSMLIQGATITKLADLLKLSSSTPAKARQSMDLITIQETDYELIDLFIDPNMYTGEIKIVDFQLPNNINVTMVSRNNNIIIPRGDTNVLPGDTLSLLLPHAQLELITTQILQQFTKINP